MGEPPVFVSDAGLDPAWVPRVGDVLAGKYRVEGILGRGGMGVVLAAHHELLDQRVAIKLLLPEISNNAEAVSRFIHEARASSRIQNEHVARVLDVGRLDDGAPFMVIEALEGMTLEQLLTERATLPVAEVVDHLMQALDAIAQAHALGIVHRDLKPSNLFLARRQDGTSQIKVLDFGISKTVDATTGLSAGRAAVTATNAILGSPAYMSPEQLLDSKSVDFRTDIWSFGVVAYELLTGKLPFDGDNVVALFAAIRETAPPSPRTLRGDLPAVLDATITKCLRADPRERFATVRELAVAIAPYGTRVGALSCERIERILPVAAVAVAAAGDSERSVRPAGVPRERREAFAETASPWATGNLTAGRTRKRKILVWSAAVVLPLGALVAVAFLRLPVGATGVAPAAVAPTPGGAAPPAAIAMPTEVTTLTLPPAATLVTAPSASATTAPSSSGSMIAPRRPARGAPAPSRSAPVFDPTIFNQH